MERCDPNMNKVYEEANSEERWKAYHTARALRPRNYLPTPTEIDGRAAIVRAYGRANVPRALMAATLYHGSPTPECVLRMVRKHGPAEAWRRLETFCDEVPEI